MSKSYKCAVKGCKVRWETKGFINEPFFCHKHIDQDPRTTSEAYPGAWRDEEDFAYNHGIEG